MAYIKLKNLKFVILIFAFCIFNFYGCATLPAPETGKAYYLNGAKYYSLDELCRLNSIQLSWDYIGQTATLDRENHRIKIMPQSNKVILDNEPINLEKPVIISDNKLFVPQSFKILVLDKIIPYVRTSVPAVKDYLVSKRVIIDAGHGGRDAGAISRWGDLKEKDVVLDIAHRLASELAKTGIKVVMTRSGDYFVPLERRAEIANESKGDLFVSIHANANRRKSLSGIEVYYLTNRVDDNLLARNAASSNKIYIDGQAIKVDSPTVRTILWDMLYTDNRRQSARLASIISKELTYYTGLRSLGVKSANFSVLRSSLMPAVLVEVAYISNKSDQRRLESNTFKEEIVQGLTKAILEFFSPNRTNYY